jgi:hypothetical protein
MTVDDVADHIGHGDALKNGAQQKGSLHTLLFVSQSAFSLIVELIDLRF